MLLRGARGTRSRRLLVMMVVRLIASLRTRSFFTAVFFVFFFIDNATIEFRQRIPTLWIAAHDAAA